MDEESAGAGPAPLWEARSWLRGRTLESLAEVNDQCLGLLHRQACESGRVPMFAGLGALWSGLDAGARRRAAGCAVLLVDAGFTDAGRWPDGAGVRDRESAPPQAPFFTVPGTVPMMRLVLTYAWHLARSEPVAARLLLGMSARCVELIGACTLSRVTVLAETHPQWLQPRWADRPQVWRDLLATALTGEPVALGRTRLRGFALLAAEARRAPPR